MINDWITFHAEINYHNFWLIPIENNDLIEALNFNVMCMMFIHIRRGICHCVMRLSVHARWVASWIRFDRTRPTACSSISHGTRVAQGWLLHFACSYGSSCTEHALQCASCFSCTIYMYVCNRYRTKALCRVRCVCFYLPLCEPKWSAGRALNSRLDSLRVLCQAVCVSVDTLYWLHCMIYRKLSSFNDEKEKNGSRHIFIQLLLFHTSYFFKSFCVDNFFRRVSLFNPSLISSLILEKNVIFFVGCSGKFWHFSKHLLFDWWCIGDRIICDRKRGGAHSARRFTKRRTGDTREHGDGLHDV